MLMRVFHQKKTKKLLTGYRNRFSEVYRLKEENKEVFEMIKGYRWMSEMVVEHETMAEHYSNDPFLSMLKEENSEEIQKLKDKIKFIDESTGNITDDKSFWILNLLRNGLTAVRIKELIPMSSKTLYQRCDEGIDQMKQHNKTGDE